MLAQGLVTLDDAFLGLGLLTAIRHHRGDYVMDLVIDLAQLGHQALALITRGPPTIGGALEQLKQVERDLAGNVHDLEPGQVGKHRQAEQEQGDKHQGAALHVQGVLGQVTKAFTQRATGRSWQAGSGMKVDMRQRRARQHQEHQTDQAPGEQPAAPLPGLVTLTEDLPGLDRQQQRENIGEIAQHHEQDISEVSTRTSGGILHLLDVAGVAETRISLVVGQQRHPQVQAQRPHGDQRTFLEAIMQLLAPERHRQGIRCCGGFLQNASIPALNARPTVCDLIEQSINHYF
ncbi:hypothetical protein D3C80_528480 [compost metagenome]